MPANDFINGTTLSASTLGSELFEDIMNIFRFGSLEIPEYFGEHI